MATGDLVSTFDLPEFDTNGILRRPDFNEVVYVACNDDDLTNTIRQYNINTSSAIDHGHSCSHADRPVILTQSADGSGIIYSCGDGRKIYLKNLNCSLEDEELFNDESGTLLLLSSDNSKVIFYNRDRTNNLGIIDLSDPDRTRKIIELSFDVTCIDTVFFSDDGRKLHVMHKASFLDDDFMLATFDYEDYLNSQSNIMQLISNKPILIPQE